LISDATELRWLVASEIFFPAVVRTATLVEVSTSHEISALILITPCGRAEIVWVICFWNFFLSTEPFFFASRR